MNGWLFISNNMKKIFYVIPIFLITFAACVDDGINEPVSPDPVIESIALNYSQLNKSLFISAKVTDPQGWETIDSVGFDLYRKDSVDSVDEEWFLAGQLVDVGPPLDIIKRDNVYSYLIDSNVLSDNEGSFRVNVQAFDEDGNESDIEIASALVAPNSPPQIYPLQLPSSFEKGDTLVFKMRVTDPQGVPDISSVTYSILKPDGKYLKDFFYLSDAGPYGGLGDEYANDGIYTVYQPSSRESKLQGLFVFYFVAKDLSGASSDTLTVPITNPGVTLIVPNSADTFSSGDTCRIQWESAYISTLRIEYTTNANTALPDYSEIATVSASTGYYDWQVSQDLSSGHCKVKIYDPDKPTRSDVSDAEFTILP